MLKMLQRQGSAVGLDLSSEAIMFAASRDARNLVLGSVTNPPFAEGTFDVALALDVIEHVDDDCAILQGLRSIVRPGGALIVTVPAFEFLWSDHDRINHHRRRYRAGELRERLEGAGFEIDRVTYCNTALFPVVAVVRRAQAVRRRFRPKADAELDSDLHRYPRLLNGLLYRLMLVETRLLRRWDMPVGVSILAVARRPAEADRQASEAENASILLVGADADVALGVQ
jgi:SAM-dependent methyltransferase